MRFVEIMFFVLVFNLTASFFSMSGMYPITINNTSYQPNRALEPMDSDGNLINNESFAYKIWTYSNNKTYLNQGVQSTTQSYLQAGGDFIRGLLYFVDTMINGVFFFGDTFRAWGVPEALVNFITYPLYFLFLIAMIQLIAGRSFDSNS